MATSSQHVVLPRIWNDPEQVLKEWPSNISPRRLKLFCDTMVPSFEYHGDFFPFAVFQCDSKVTTWGLEWIETQDQKVVICPKMTYMERGHPTTGLNVLECQGLDNSTAILLVQEMIPKSEESIRYGLILDYVKMDLDLCGSITKKGMLSSLNNSHVWTPAEIKDEWDIIDEQRQKKNGTTPHALVSPAKPAAKPKAKKRKSIVGAPGDEEVEEGSQKKKKKSNTPALTIQRAVNMTDVDINKLSPEEMKAIHKLYQDVFVPLYKWSKKPLEDAQGKLIRVHYKFLHQAPPGKLVYRGIQQDHLKKIKNRILVDADYTSENRYITVLPLKFGPHGADKKVKFWDDCSRKESLTDKSHYYIIGGQHTVEATRLLVENGDIPVRDKAWASTFSIIPIWRKYDPKNNDICHLSRALNQNIVGEQREQNFTKQLLHCRIKWKDVGCPMPSLHGRSHSAEYTAFYPVVSTIFTGVKGADAADLKIPLLFLEDDEDVNKWIRIEERFLMGDLPDGAGENSKAKRKPFAKNDFKPLYGLQTEDINFLAGLVENGDVCMKNVKPGAFFLGRTVISLTAAGARERQIRVMKNELMFHFRQHPLPSKQPDYVPYTAAEWDTFAEEKKITRNELELWVDKSLATELGKEWLKGRTQGLNKTTDPNDCPEAVKSMWQTFMGVHAQEALEAAAVQNFEMRYCCRELDESTWDISSIMAESVVKSWRGVGQTHVYFWFLFEITRAGARAKVLENLKLKRLFDALEYRDSTSHVQRARSPAVLMTDAQGFHAVLCHLQRRFEQSRSQVWDWHVVNYIPDGSDGFPRPITGSHFNVFIVFLFEHDEENGSTAAFHAFFPGLQDLSAVYKADDMEDIETCYRRRPKPWFRVTSALNIFGTLTFKDMVLVNVNGASEFTFLGMWAGWKVLEIVDSAEASAEACTVARQIWDQFNQHHQDSEEKDEEEELAGTHEGEDESGRDTDSNGENDDDDDGEGAAGGAIEIPADEEEAQGEDVDSSATDSSATEDDVPPPESSTRNLTRKSSSKPSPSLRKSSLGRERRLKRSLDFPFNDFSPLPSQVAGGVQHTDDDCEVLSPSKFVGSSVPSAEVALRRSTAIGLKEPTDVASDVRTGKPAVDGLHVVVEEHVSANVLFDDPYSLSTIAEQTGDKERMGKPSGDLQMSESPVRGISRDVSGLPGNLGLSQCTGDEPRSSGDLQMISLQSEQTVGDPTGTGKDAEKSGDVPGAASCSPRLGVEDIRPAEGCLNSDAVNVSGQTGCSPRHSDDAVVEVKGSAASGDLQMAGVLVASSAVDMPENILQDTLSDLNPMSPPAESSKVTPFSAIPIPASTTAEILENRKKFEVFLDCPKFKYDKKGKITKSSMEARNVWKANQYLYSSLFELPVDRYTQAQEEEEMRPTELEEGKGASGPEHPTQALSREEEEVPCLKYTAPRSSHS